MTDVMTLEEACTFLRHSAECAEALADIKRDNSMPARDVAEHHRKTAFAIRLVLRELER